jgi:hypothetical protein
MAYWGPRIDEVAILAEDLVAAGTPSAARECISHCAYRSNGSLQT